jgi:hypothetical protein
VRVSEYAAEACEQKRARMRSKSGGGSCRRPQCRGEQPGRERPLSSAIIAAGPQSLAAIKPPVIPSDTRDAIPPVSARGPIPSTYFTPRLRTYFTPMERTGYPRAIWTNNCASLYGARPRRHQTVCFHFSSSGCIRTLSEPLGIRNDRSRVSLTSHINRSLRRTKYPFVSHEADTVAMWFSP